MNFSAKHSVGEFSHSRLGNLIVIVSKSIETCVKFVFQLLDKIWIRKLRLAQSSLQNISRFFLSLDPGQTGFIATSALIKWRRNLSVLL